MQAIPVNDQNFDEVVLENDTPVLVDFWAPWCGPCRAMSPVVDEVASDLAGQARVVKVNVDEAGSSAARYGITSIPTFVVVNNGEVTDRVTGVVPGERLISAVQAQLN